MSLKKHVSYCSNRDQTQQSSLFDKWKMPWIIGLIEARFSRYDSRRIKSSTWIYINWLIYWLSNAIPIRIRNTFSVPARVTGQLCIENDNCIHSGDFEKNFVSNFILSFSHFCFCFFSQFPGICLSIVSKLVWKCE